MWSTRRKRKNLLHLHAATDVHWSGSKRGSVEHLQLHTVLPALQIIPNLRLLSLRHADINETQQVIIFGLSTLRTLVVRSCCFHPSTTPIPHSHVTALKLAHNDTQTSRHLLSVFASTVEDLEVDSSDGTVSCVRLGGFIELPKLSTFTMTSTGFYPGIVTRQAILTTSKRCTSITTLRILFRIRLSDVSLHHSDFPALRSLTCDQQLAVSLLPVRQVTTYVQYIIPSRKEDPGCFSTHSPRTMRGSQT